MPPHSLEPSSCTMAALVSESTLTALVLHMSSLSPLSPGDSHVVSTNEEAGYELPQVAAQLLQPSGRCPEHQRARPVPGEAAHPLQLEVDSPGEKLNKII